MEVHGKHSICEIYNADPAILDNLDMIRDILRCAAQAAGATIRGEAYEKFEPQGVSVVLLLSESHISIHTYPEYGYAAVDCFTCGRHCDPVAACSYIISKLGDDCIANMVHIKRPIPVSLGCCSNA
jgi:S-adenosylmethionine decarboxylase